MTYLPGNPGYHPPQPPGAYGVSNPSFTKAADTASKVPLYLQAAVVVLGLATYLASFGPILTVAESGVSGPTGPALVGRAGLAIPLAVLAALLAAVSLLPKAKNYTAVVAVLAVLAALVAIARTVNKGDAYSVGWALWLVLSFSILQAVAAAAVLLLDAGVVTAPAPRPKYDPYAQYGLPPGGGYYAPPSQPLGHLGRGPQQPGYPSYGGYPSGPPSGGFTAPPPSPGAYGSGSQSTEQQGPPTPPTGFPSFSPPSAAGSTTGGGQGSTNSGPGQQSQSGQSSPSASSTPSGPTEP